MPSINFYLDRPDSEGKCPIFLVYQSKGRKFKHYTKEKILQKYWDKKKQRAKSISDASEINDLLSHLAGKLKTIERQLRITNDSYSFDEVKQDLLNRKEKNVIKMIDLVNLDDLTYISFLDKCWSSLPIEKNHNFFTSSMNNRILVITISI